MMKDVSRNAGGGGGGTTLGAATSWTGKHFSLQTKTSRDRPKSAPYLRLKNSKRTRSIGELGTLWGFFFEKKLTMPKN